MAKMENTPQGEKNPIPKLQGHGVHAVARHHLKLLVAAGLEQLLKSRTRDADKSFSENKRLERRIDLKIATGALVRPLQNSGHSKNNIEDIADQSEQFSQKQPSILRKNKRRNKEDLQVIFLPDIAYDTPQGEIIASIQAWVYCQKSRHRLTHMLARMFGLDIATLDEATRQIFYARTQLFMVDSSPGCQIHVRDAQGGHHILPATGADGRTQHHITLSATTHRKETVCKIQFQLDKGATSASYPSMAVPEEVACFYVPPFGLSIISDIDDTIKQSFVCDKKKLLRTTFLEEYQSVPQMREWYQELAKDERVAFHYVSSSPIQLYPALQNFMQAHHYPEGSVHLREATRWSEVLPRPGSSKQHKKAVITRLLDSLDKRKFVLVGDTAGDDALIYAELAARYPHQIVAICMRCVTNHDPSRLYDKIFTGISPNSWLVSDNVNEMRQFITKLDILNDR